MKAFLAASTFAVGLFVGYAIHDADLSGAADDEARAMRDVQLTCLTDTVVEQVRRSGSIDVAFPICKEEVKRTLGKAFEHLDHIALRAVFAAITAAQFAEYGPSSAVSYAAIAASPTLNCANTVILTGLLFGEDATSLRPIGFDGGAVGNHAQLYYSARDQSGAPITLVLDPTTGVVANVAFDDLLSGRPVAIDRIRSFAIRAKSIDTFRERVYEAILLGRYKPSDFMYMHASVKEMKTKGTSNSYFSPGGITLRQRAEKAAQEAKYE